MCTRAARTVRRYRVGIFFSRCSFVCGVCVCECFEGGGALVVVCTTSCCDVNQSRFSVLHRSKIAVKVFDESVCSSSMRGRRKTCVRAHDLWMSTNCTQNSGY